MYLPFTHKLGYVLAHFFSIPVLSYQYVETRFVSFITLAVNMMTTKDTNTNPKIIHVAIFPIIWNRQCF